MEEDQNKEQAVFFSIKVMDEAISRLKSDPLQGVEKWMTDMFEVVMSRRAVTVARSPNFCVYETNFGFGRPTKVEMVTGLNCAAFAEDGNEEGGIEVGVALTSVVECNVLDPSPMAKVGWIKKKEESQCWGDEKCVWFNHWFLSSFSNVLLLPLLSISISLSVGYLPSILLTKLYQQL